MNIEVRKTTAPKQLPSGKLGFGRLFTDHQFCMTYTAGQGWHSAHVEPYGSFSLDPAAAVLHYGQAIFEGLKAFRGKDGKVRLFRPRAHAERFARSAETVCMPAVAADDFIEAVRAVVRVDDAWVPTAQGSSLYIRPTMIATEAFLGVRPSNEYLFYVILSPVDAYYAEGFNPLKIWVERERVRAPSGGVGTAKTGANYVASLYAAERAKKLGYAQVLWLDGAEHKYLEEVGTMNLFVQIGDEIITPSLGTSILRGVTRDSVLTLLRSWGLNAVERRLSLDEIREASRAGTLREIFGTGTAAVISPVGSLGTEDGPIVVRDGSVGPIARRLYDTISGIQFGTEADPHEWMVDV